jgi:hypothetical protein
MGVDIINGSGNGGVFEDTIMGWSYSEEVTSLEPGNVKGATGQVSFRAGELTADKVGNTHPNSKLMINNAISLRDDDYGIVDVKVNSISTNAGIVSVTGDTLQWRLNTTKTAMPVPNVNQTDVTQSVPANLLGAINYYCGLVGIVPTIDEELSDELEAVTVNFIGWKGNVWEHLKMLCAASSSSATVNSPFEMFVGEDGLAFRKALTTASDLEEFKSDHSVNVSSGNPAKQVDIYRYKTSYGQKNVFEQSNYDESGENPGKFLASITDSMQVEAGETVTKRVKINATLETVNQPVCKSTITRDYPNPYEGTTGEYVVFGNDGYAIEPGQWDMYGGNVKVALTDVPDEIEITVKAPAVDSLEKALGGTGYAPYRIGVESVEGADYPAFWITGIGVFFEKRKHTILTGAPEDYAPTDSSATIDNPFIIGLGQVYSRGVAAAQAICGPVVTASSTLATANAFGQTIGRTELMNSNKFRIESASYSESSVSIEATAYVSVAEFNAKWTGKTFANFKSIALDPEVYAEEALRFNEFTVIPLMEAN